MVAEAVVEVVAGKNPSKIKVGAQKKQPKLLFLSLYLLRSRNELLVRRY